jgi:hypothetical protein
MRVNNRVTPAGNHEAASRSRIPVDSGCNCVRGEHQQTPNRSRAFARGPLHGGHSGGGSGGGEGGSSGHSSYHDSGRRAGGGGDRGGQGHANSHATGYTHGGYDTCHRIDEIHCAKKGTEVSDSDGFPAYSARLRDLLFPKKFKPLGITYYDAKQDLVQWLKCYA